MSVEAIDEGSARRRVIYHEWQAMADAQVRPAAAARDLIRAPKNERGSEMWAGPGLAALAIGGAAATDATRTVLTWTLIGAALLAVVWSCSTLTPRLVAKWRSWRGTGRHRATGRNCKVVVATLLVQEEEP